MKTSDLKLLRAARRDRLVAAGAVMDAYKSTRSRVIPSGKVYKRKPRTGGWT